MVDERPAHGTRRGLRRAAASLALAGSLLLAPSVAATTRAETVSARAGALPTATGKSTRWAWCMYAGVFVYCDGDRDSWTFRIGPMWCWFPPLERLLDGALRPGKWQWCLTDTVPASKPKVTPVPRRTQQ